MVNASTHGPRCTRTLFVRAGGRDTGHEIHGMPSHFSHLMRDWLPRFRACLPLLSATPDCPPPALLVPAVLQPLYREVVFEFAPADVVLMDLDDAALTREGTRFCEHNTSEPEYWATYTELREHRRGEGCRSADVVFAVRSTDPRMLLLQTALPFERAAQSGAERRLIVNPRAAWDTVRWTAQQHNLTAEMVTFEELPFAQQWRKTCSCCLLVAQHGAAIGHALWSTAARVAVLQLPPWGRAVLWWENILRQNGVTLLLSSAHVVLPLNSTQYDVDRRDQGADLRSRGQLVVNVTTLRADLSRALTPSVNPGDSIALRPKIDVT